MSADKTTNTNKRILIFEDTESFMKMMRMRLKSAGYKVICANDGLSGLNLARQKKPDLIILDLMLPGMHGHQVCRMLKFDKQYAHIPVLIFTSRDMEKDAELAKSCRADAYVIKTINSAIVMEIIGDLIKRASTLQAKNR